jgi:hypothetical protein
LPPKSSPSFAISGTSPLVDTVIRRADSAMPSGCVRRRKRARSRVVVVERFAHPHEDDVAQTLVRLEPGAARDDLGDDLVGPEVRLRPATPLAQKMHPIAQPTCVETHWVTRTRARRPSRARIRPCSSHRRSRRVGILLPSVHRRGQKAASSRDAGNEHRFDGRTVAKPNEELACGVPRPHARWQPST